MKDLEIIIIGSSGAGKTNVAELLRRTFEEKGIAVVTVQDSFDDSVDVRQLTPLAFDERLKRLLPNLRVDVKTKHKLITSPFRKAAQNG